MDKIVLFIFTLFFPITISFADTEQSSASYVKIDAKHIVNRCMEFEKSLDEKNKHSLTINCFMKEIESHSKILLNSKIIDNKEFLKNIESLMQNIKESYETVCLKRVILPCNIEKSKNNASLSVIYELKDILIAIIDNLNEFKIDENTPEPK